MKIPIILQKIITPMLLFVGILAFVGTQLPALLSYHEQYQLFLFTADYFTNSIKVPGGLADYISEFLTQFYLKPWLGASMIALTLTVLQWFTAVSYNKSGSALSPLCCGLLAAIVPLVILRNMGDENLLLSLPVSLALTQAVLAIVLCVNLKDWRWTSLISVLVFIALYWCVGGVALLFVIELSLLSPAMKKRWLVLASTLAVSIGWILLLGAVWFPEYPEWRFFCGINYYRIPNIPAEGLLPICGTLALTTLVVYIVGLTGTKKLFSRDDFTLWSTVASAAACVIAAVTVPSGYMKGKMDIFTYDMLVRNNRWQDVLDFAKENTPTDDISLQAVNLALGKTGQLGDNMFHYPQKGIESLIAPYSRDNTSCLVTAEAFWHLGMVNSAFRYTFDIQEAIMNDRRSGRFMKRMAECMIVNGQYLVARKYIDMLKHSLYYSDWAKEAETYLDNEEKIAQHPDWNAIRLNRYKNEMLYYYPEIDKMLGLLAIQSDGRNLLAWDYFNGALMLKGDVQTLTGMYHYADSLYHLPRIPEQVQEAIGMCWTAGRQSFDGIPYPISETVKQRIASLAQTVMKNQNNPGMWKAMFPGTYCVYFLEKQMQKAAPVSHEKSNEREG